MSCEGNGSTDERMGEALIKEVIVKELKDVSSEEVPCLTPLNVKTDQEKKIVTQLANMIRIVGDKVQGDQDFQDCIDGMAHTPGCRLEMFNQVTEKVFEEGITWEKIAVLFYVAGKMALKMVEAHLPQTVRDILDWTVKFFKNNLLTWIREHGGWINSFSDLAVASVQSVSSMTGQRCGLVLFFTAGLALGSLITWRLIRQH